MHKVCVCPCSCVFEQSKMDDDVPMSKSDDGVDEDVKMEPLSFTPAPLSEEVEKIVRGWSEVQVLHWLQEYAKLSPVRVLFSLVYQFVSFVLTGWCLFPLIPGRITLVRWWNSGCQVHNCAR